MFDIATIVSFLLVIIFIGKKFREKISDFFSINSVRFWLLPIAPMTVYIFFIAAGNDDVSLKNLPIIALYLFLPSLIVYWSKKTAKNNFLLDITFAFLIWLPVEFGLVPIMWTSGKQPPILFSFAVLFYILCLVTVWKSLPLYCEWRFSKNDWRLVRNVFILLFIAILPTAFALDFIKFGLRQSFTEHPAKIAIAYALSIFFTTALPEELIFRGLIQNAILKKFSFYWGLLIASVIFGLGHLNNTQGGFPMPNWRFVLLATMAGLGYGYVFMNRRSLIAAVLLHTLVNFTWVIFFAGK